MVLLPFDILNRTTLQERWPKFIIVFFITCIDFSRLCWESLTVELDTRTQMFFLFQVGLRSHFYNVVIIDARFQVNWSYGEDTGTKLHRLHINILSHIRKPITKIWSVVLFGVLIFHIDCLSALKVL